MYHKANRAHLLGEGVGDLLDYHLVEHASVAPVAQPQLEALGFNDVPGGRVFDDETSEVGLARDRAQAGELRAVKRVPRLLAALPVDQVKPLGCTSDLLAEVLRTFASSRRHC